MTEGEGFLGRWSRLKQEAKQEPAIPEEPAPPPEEAPGDEAKVEAEAAPPPPLPPVESLGADSDYTQFLAAHVPEELKRQALRKAWVSDPAIANFRGFADYDWDLNAPGYGQLLPTDNIQRLLDAVLGEDIKTDEPAEHPSADPGTESEQPAIAETDEDADKRGRDGETFEV